MPKPRGRFFERAQPRAVHPATTELIDEPPALADDEQAAVGSLRRFELRCYVVGVTDAVLARVRRPFPIEPIRTLDAVHLATTELIDEPPALVVVVTRDTRVRENAEALGYAVE